MTRKKILHVKKTSFKELTQQWGFPPYLYKFKEVYIVCTAKGVINWGTSTVYRAGELVDKNNVIIL